MRDQERGAPIETNLRLYPWYQFARNLAFWQAVWFLYFEQVLTAPQAILLAAAYDIINVALELPSGYFSDCVGRRITLIISAIANIAGCILFFAGGPLWVFLLAQGMFAVTIAFNSGTDSALLYDSLKALGREDEVAEREATASRASYLGFAASALLGGALVTIGTGENFAVAYAATAASGALALAITLRFVEPTGDDRRTTAPPVAQLARLARRLRDHMLAWMCAFFALLYILSHIPFIYIQPYVREVMQSVSGEDWTPLVIGIVIATMMGISAAMASVVVPLRERIGTRAMFACALALQVAVIAGMAATIHPAITLLVLLRMVPATLTRPFMLEAIQPRLDSDHRATFLSLVNLIARLLFTATLVALAWATTGKQTVDREALSVVLPWCAGLGALAAAALIALWPKPNDAPRRTARP
ncbi:MAG: MFS transporter [Pseudomonadota bacterium]